MSRHPHASEDVIYGRQAILECLKAGRRQIRRLMVQDGLRASELLGEILAAAQTAKATIQPVRKPDLDRATRSGHHQGVALACAPYPYADEDAAWQAVEASGEPAFFLLLDHVQDPQNVGSLLRTADAAGAQAVFLPRDRAAGVTPAAVRASSGAAEHLCVVRVANMVQTIDRLKQREVWVCGLDASPDGAVFTEEPLLGEAVALVVGSEGEGMARLVRERCDARVRLPMCGRVQSLNAAVSGAIAMYEVRRRRTPGNP